MAALLLKRLPTARDSAGRRFLLASSSSAPLVGTSRVGDSIEHAPPCPGVALFSWVGVALGMPKLPAKLRPHVQDLPDWAAQVVAAALVYAYETGVEVNVEALAFGLSLASAGRMGWRKFKAWQEARKARKLLAVAAARQGELDHARNMRRVRHGQEPDRPLIAAELLDPDDDDLDDPAGRWPPGLEHLAQPSVAERLAEPMSPEELEAFKAELADARLAPADLADLDTPVEGLPLDDDEV